MCGRKRPRTVGPRNIPTEISPRIEGWPIFCINSAASLAQPSNTASAMNIVITSCGVKCCMANHTLQKIHHRINPSERLNTNSQRFFGSCLDVHVDDELGQTLWRPYSLGSEGASASPSLP